MIRLFRRSKASQNVYLGGNHGRLVGRQLNLKTAHYYRPLYVVTTNMNSKCDSLQVFMPQIFWHDRKEIMSLHVQPQTPDGQYVSEEGRQAEMCYKLCTASVQNEVRVWELAFSKSKKPGFEEHYELGVNFVANLVGHTVPLNVVQYSPNGELIASGDVDGKLYIWKIHPRDDNFVQTDEKPLDDEDAQFEIPPNKENWMRAFAPIGHDTDLNSLVFSPNSQFICTAANDDLRLVNALTGKQIWNNRGFRRLINGLAFDPLGRYIVTMSSDRRMDIVESKKGTRLRTCHSETIPETVINGQKFEKKKYKFFFDHHVYTLTRSPDFSPCGELLFAPAGQLEAAEANTYGTYVFRRCDFDKCLPHALFPCVKPTLMVRVSPIKYALRTDTEENFLGLQYRMIFAVMCAESIYFYDTQTEIPIGFVYDLSYNNLTSISWTPDGKVLAVSSLEGFNFFLRIRTDQLQAIELQIDRADSPPLKKPAAPKPEPIEFSATTPLANDQTANTEQRERSPSQTPSTSSIKTPKRSKKSSPSTKSEEEQKSCTTPKRSNSEVPKKRKISTFFKPITEEEKKSPEQ